MNKKELFIDEINYLKNDDIKKSVAILIEMLPDYFFHEAASSTGKYHPKYALGDGGLLRHTKAACYIAHELLNNPAIGEKYTSREKDLMIVGLIMHDGLKKGMVEEKYTRFDHPLLVSKLIMENASMLHMSIDEVRRMCMMIESHMGKWNTSKYSKVELPVPRDEYQRFVHRCDYLASRNYLDVKFLKLDII